MESKGVPNKCSVCQEELVWQDESHPEIPTNVAICYWPKNVKLKRHKDQEYYFCFDCWLDSMGLKSEKKVKVVDFKSEEAINLGKKGKGRV